LSAPVSPSILNHYNQAGRDFLLYEEAGRLLYYNIIAEKGSHVLVLGSPGSGKTQKLTWLASWLAPIETIVWIDSCKDNECTPLLKFKLPVRFIVPAWCSVAVENSPCEYEVMEATFPEDVWQLVEPRAINIIPIRAFFRSEKAQSNWLARMFRALNDQAYNIAKNKKPNLKGKTPMRVFADEFQKICPSTSLTNDRDRIEAGQEVATNILEVRAHEIGLAGGTQDWGFILPGARRNLPARILCRGAVVKQSESPKLYRLRGFFENYEPNEGLFVFQDGSYFPSTCPWQFPLYRHPPGCNVIYSGCYDEPDEGIEEVREEIPDNWQQYAGRYLTDEVGGE